MGGQGAVENLETATQTKVEARPKMFKVLVARNATERLKKGRGCSSEVGLHTGTPSLNPLMRRIK